MSIFQWMTAMIGVDGENLLEKPNHVKHRIQQLVQQGIETGVVRPLEWTYYCEENHGTVLK